MLSKPERDLFLRMVLSRGTMAMAGAMTIALSAWGFVLVSFRLHPGDLRLELTPMTDWSVAFTMLTLRLSLIVTGALFLLMGWDVMEADALRSFGDYQRAVEEGEGR